MPIAAPNPYFRPVIVHDSYYDIVLKDAPTSYWRLGESSGPTAVDEMGVANHTYINSPTYGVAGLVSDPNNDTAVDFDNAGYTGGVALGTLTLPYTIEAWVFIPTGYAIDKPVFLTHDHSSFYFGFTLSISSDRKIQFRNGDGGAPAPESRRSFISDGVIPYDTPSHIVAIGYDLTTAEIYLNGVLQSLTTSGTGSSINFSQGVPRIGQNSISIGPSTCNFPVDEVAVYEGKALSAQQVLTHYNAGIA